MALRRPASRLLFWVACLLLVGAAANLVAARVLPSDGFRDLARVAMALLLSALAAIPFFFALLLGRTTDMPRWMSLAAMVGLVPGVIALAVIISARF